WKQAVVSDLGGAEGLSQGALTVLESAAQLLVLRDSASRQLMLLDRLVDPRGQVNGLVAAYCRVTTALSAGLRQLDALKRHPKPGTALLAILHPDPPRLRAERAARQEAEWQAEEERLAKEAAEPRHDAPGAHPEPPGATQPSSEQTPEGVS